MQKIDREHRRRSYAISSDIALGQASSGPPSGSRTEEMVAKSGKFIDEFFVAVGDQDAAVRLEEITPGNFRKYSESFPGKIPSKDNGIKYDCMDFSLDYEAYLSYSPAEVYKDENIVGEFHWSFGDVRARVFPDAGELEILSKIGAEIGAGGYPASHTCADLSIGIKLGWKGILEKIKNNLQKFERLEKKEETEYLKAAEITCKAIINFIKKHSDKALSLAEKEENKEQKERLLRIAKVCDNISENPPANFHEGIQWVWFFIMVERMQLGGNGYGRIDQYLYDLYKKGIEEKSISRDDARNLVAELYLKYKTFYSLGGRDKDGNDATNELSWVCLEAYDMLGCIMEFGVLWHSDINKDFFRYACAVVARHGNGAPALINQDVLRDSEIYYGVKPADAWNVSYSGCFWYCIPGKEWCCHDMLSISGIKCFMNALDIAFQIKITSYDQLWNLYCIQVDKAIKALKEMTDWQFEKIPYVWPEIVTSLLTNDCIENGKDITDNGTPYNTSVVQFSGLANIADSLIAIKKLIFEEKKINLNELKIALDCNFEGYENIRQMLLNCPKYGNDIDEADILAQEVAEQYRQNLSEYNNCKGFAYRPAFFSWAGHAYANRILGATPDGRKKDDPLAQGANPMHGRNKLGATATARSMSKLDFKRNAGGPFQLELDPSILKVYDPGRLTEGLVVPYFKMNGAHIFINIYSVETLEKAMKNPEEYEHIVIRVTGFAAHFVQLDRELQQEIIMRTRHSA